MALTGGPARDIKWGGLVLRPTKDGELEFQTNSFEYETEASPNGDNYATASAIIGYVQQECAFTPTEFSELKRLQDGEERSGVVTAVNGDVISINGRIEGELLLADGKATVKFAGQVRVQ